MYKKFLVLSLVLALFVLVAMLVVTGGSGPTPVKAAGVVDNVTVRQPSVRPPFQQDAVCSCAADIYNCQDSFATQAEAQACLDYCRSQGYGDVHHLDRDNDGVACENLASSSPVEVLTGDNQTPTPTPQPAELPIPGVVTPAAAPQTNNLIGNGNFEFGFYPVPELGFEPPDIGNIPFGWNWYRSQAYGKYDIDNNEGFGLVCSGSGDPAKNALGIYMQSTDQPDARLGVYQTVDVVPNVQYLFAISGTIQVQKGGSSPDINNRVELVFDQTGGSDWRAIPHEKWTLLPWREQELEFSPSGPEDPDIAKVENYYAVVKARSNKMTIFIDAWRKWPNWRTSIFTFDCVSLIPLSDANVSAIVPELAGISTTAVDKALAGSSSRVQAQPAAASEPANGPAAAQPAVIIPPSGGVPEAKNNTVLIVIVSVIVIFGLVGAGIWNARRQK